jgi:hypothetical protein
MDLFSHRKYDNAAAYVISMWHLEDLLRANGLDLYRVVDQLVEPMDADPHAKASIATWYAAVIERMKAEGITRHGHLSEVEEVVNELEFLHTSLVQVMNDDSYERLCQPALPAIRDLQRKAGEEAVGAVETALTAIYGVMVLRAAGKPVSEGTAAAEHHFRRMLEHLSEHHRQMRKLPGISLN